MNLLGIRELFVKISGRYDLVNPSTFADNGADHFIQEGQRSLERRLNISATKAKFFTTLSEGGYKIELQNCRAIREVWVMDNAARSELTKLEEYDLRGQHQKFVSNMYTVPLSTMDTGRPLYFYPTNLRRVPEDEDGSTDSAVLSSFLETTSPYDPTYTGIVLFPRAEKEFEVEVSGLFYSPKLTANTDENYWSVTYPNLLVMAAVKQVEIMYRGLKAGSSWDRLMEPELENIEKDMVEEEVSTVHNMRG